MKGNLFTSQDAYFDYNLLSNAWFSFLLQNLPIVKTQK